MMRDCFKEGHAFEILGDYIVCKFCGFSRLRPDRTFFNKKKHPYDIKEGLKEQKEICFECKHTKRFHNSVHVEGACSQPTCQCSCFIKSGVYHGMDLFDAYEKGIGDALKFLRKKNYDVSYTFHEIINDAKDEGGVGEKHE